VQELARLKAPPSPQDLLLQTVMTNAQDSGAHNARPDSSPAGRGPPGYPHRNGVAGRAFGEVVVHRADVFAMLRGLAFLDGRETCAVEALPAGIAAGGFEEGGQDIGVLDQRISLAVGLDVPGPAHDEGGMEAFLPIGPFADRPLAALLGTGEDQGAAGQVGLVEGLENVAKRLVHHPAPVYELFQACFGVG
jgi:hypothetical protein